MVLRTLRKIFRTNLSFNLLNNYCLAVPYVLIGGGTASYYASLAIRARDPDAKILIISNESSTPYSRIPLSKEFWWYGNEETPERLSYKRLRPDGGVKDEYAEYEADGFYLNSHELEQWKSGAVGLLKNTTAVRIDPGKSVVYLDDGKEVQFEKCLIATGSIPQLYKELTEAITDGKRNTPATARIKEQLKHTLFVYHTAEDYRKLEAEISKRIKFQEQTKDVSAEKNSQKPKLVIIGGGLLAVELAYSLNRRFVRRPMVNDKPPSVDVILIIPEHESVLADILPPILARHATQELKDQGIQVLSNSSIQSASLFTTDTTANRSSSSGVKFSLDDPIPPKVELQLLQEGSENHNQVQKQSINCDILVLGLGADPNTELAKASGLPLDKVNGGILADKNLRVVGDDHNIWVAGDVASFMDPALRRRRRETHWEHAQTTGRLAGANMTGAERTYEHQAGFVSLVSPNVHISGVGIVDAIRLKTVTYIAEENTNWRLPTAGKLDELRAVTFYIDPSTRRLTGVTTYNVHGYGMELSRKLVRDSGAHTPDELRELVKLYDLYGLAEKQEETDDATQNKDQIPTTTADAKQD